MFTLTVYRGDRLVQELELEGPEVNIGRKIENTVVLPDDGKGVSRVHAILRVEHGEYVLYDGNSRNGTFVDGKPIKRMVLQPGHDFVIGPYRLILGAPDHAESTPTVVATREMPAAPSRESTQRGAASATAGAGQHTASSATKSRHPAAARVQPSKEPTIKQPLPVAYVAGGAIAVVLLAVVLVWTLWPSPVEQQQAEGMTSTTTIPEVTTSIPEPPPDPYAEQITMATTAIEGLPTVVDGKNYPAARGEIERILKDYIAPILAADAQHAQALDIESQLKMRLDEVRKLEIASRPVIKKDPVPVKRDATDVDPRPGESVADYERRNTEVKQDYELAKKYFNTGDTLSAFKLFSDLANREPAYLDIGAYVKNAQERLDEERRQILNEGLRHEGAGHKSYLARNWQQAAGELTQALAAFQRAAALEAPDIQKHIAANLERRQLVAKEALAVARSHANRRNRAEAQKWFQLIVELLPAGDPVRTDAERDLQKLNPGFNDLSPAAQHLPAPVSLSSRSV